MRCVSLYSDPYDTGVLVIDDMDEPRSPLKIVSICALCVLADYFPELED